MSICHNSNGPDKPKWKLLGGSHRRTAQALYVEIKWLAKKFGIEHLGFLTLTFAENIQCAKEAQKRFNSLRTGVLAARYRVCIGVLQRQKSGRIHYHLVVVLADDIRSGVDFDAIERGDYRSAGPALRSEWAYWRVTARAYRFGRTELLPVRSNEDGIARYVGSYIRQHIEQREERDKGVRTVKWIGFGAGERTASSRFGWAGSRGRLWRRQVALFAESCGIFDMAGIRERYGPQWAFFLADAIMAIDPEVGVPKPGKMFDGEPVWAVPEWASELVKVVCGEWTPERLQDAVEMRLYANRMEMCGRKPGSVSGLCD